MEYYALRDIYIVIFLHQRDEDFVQDSVKIGIIRNISMVDLLLHQPQARKSTRAFLF